MVSFRGQKRLGPRPDWSPLGVQFKISDEHPHPFHMRSPPPPTWQETDQLVKKNASFKKRNWKLTLIKMKPQI